VVKSIAMRNFAPRFAPCVWPILQTFTSLDSLPPLAGCVATAGTFDGVHLGHQAILQGLVHLAQRQGVPSVVITYQPHPRLVLFPEQTDLRLLSTPAEKTASLQAAGIDVQLILPFTKDFASWSYTQYVDRVIVAGLQAGMFVLGYDHQFGKDRTGSFATLQELAALRGFLLEEIPPHMVADAAVSSSKIRHALQAGDVHTAQLYLGRPYPLSGTVVKGLQLGRTLGWPTLNIAIDNPHKLLPAEGVYAVDVVIQGQRYAGALNIGQNPTITGKGWSCEVHVLDFSADVYGQTVTVAFCHHLRPEAKFASLDALKAQITADVAQTRALLL